MTPRAAAAGQSGCTVGSGGTAGLGAFGSFVMALQITGPLSNLVAGTIRAAAGDLETRIDIRTGDEIEELAGNFNDMVQEIRSNQQAIGELIGLNSTRMVFLVDELEQRGLVERRRNAADRRSYALYLTAKGRDTLRQVQAAGTSHQDDVGAVLTAAERVQLTGLLRRLAAGQGITEHSLPARPPVRSHR